MSAQRLASLGGSLGESPRSASASLPRPRTHGVSYGNLLALALRSRTHTHLPNQTMTGDMLHLFVPYGYGSPFPSALPFLARGVPPYQHASNRAKALLLPRFLLSARSEDR